MGVSCKRCIICVVSIFSIFIRVGSGKGVLPHFQQYFSYIVAVSFIGEETGVSGENHRPVAIPWQTLSS